MAVATKAAAFGVLLRLFDVALIGAQRDWAPRSRRSPRSRSSSATSARSARPRSSACSPTRASRRPATCSRGVVVATQLGVDGDGLLPGRLPADEPRRVRGDRRARARDARTATTSTRSPASAATRPLLAWPMTIAMLVARRHPGDGRLHRQVLPDPRARRRRLHLARRSCIVIGSMISLGYYLRVVAAIWMRDAPDAPALAPRSTRAACRAIAGGSQEADAPPRPRRPVAARGRCSSRSCSRRRDGLLRDRPAAAVRAGRSTPPNSLTSFL